MLEIPDETAQVGVCNEHTVYREAKEKKEQFVGEQENPV